MAISYLRDICVIINSELESIVNLLDCGPVCLCAPGAPRQRANWGRCALGFDIKVDKTFPVSTQIVRTINIINLALPGNTSK